MRMDGLALISQQVKFCSSTFSAWYSNGIYILKFLGYAVAPPPTLVGDRQKFFVWFFVCYLAKFSYNGWTAEIAGLTNFVVLRVPPSIDRHGFDTLNTFP